MVRYNYPIVWARSIETIIKDYLIVLPRISYESHIFIIIETKRKSHESGKKKVTVDYKIMLSDMFYTKASCRKFDTGVSSRRIIKVVALCIVRFRELRLFLLYVDTIYSIDLNIKLFINSINKDIRYIL